ncbi:Uncharacterised protein [Candidatus Gugararchaeum adminiculabundum]|nr:Uncharacterised protein [Candidatus Gugararchaeum adminiculabundum]
MPSPSSMSSPVSINERAVMPTLVTDVIFAVASSSDSVVEMSSLIFFTSDSSLVTSKTP